ncbi:MAG TPA: hypothetical protein VHP35_16330 [Terriglobia bacterium]|nr:hypothetical protein [Terriglobia bacterium]
MASIRLAAIYVARQDLDYLESSVRSVLPFVETILIGVPGGHEIDRESLQAACATNSDVVGSQPKVTVGVRGAVEQASGRTSIRCIEGAWKDQAECANALLKELLAQGITHVLLLEPEDILSSRDLADMLLFVSEHPEAGQFLVRCLDYWKSPSYRIEPPDPEPRVLISRITERTRIAAPNTTNESPVISLPEAAGSLHRFAFASPSRIVKRRVALMHISQDIRQRWETEVWQAWNGQRHQRNLRPVSPERFRAAQRINPGQSAAGSLQPPLCAT